MSEIDTLQLHFKTLRMSTAGQVVGEVITTARQNDWSLAQYTCELLERSVLFAPTYKVVSGLLRAKRDLELERELGFA